MATVKAVLRKKKNPEGLYPIAIRITKDRKSSYLGIGQYIDENFWDERNRCVRKSHPNAKDINHILLIKIAEANNKVLRAEETKDYQSVRSIRKQIKQTKNIDFIEVANVHLDNLRNREKHNQYKIELGRINKFKCFACKEELQFNKVTISMLKEFETYLIHVEKLSPRTVVNYLILIRTIYNLGINQYEIDKAGYPFGKGKVQIKIPESEKIGLSIGELKKLENISNITEAQRRAVQVWLISFYFAGVRVGDVIKLKWSDFKDDRLVYRMGKNSKLVSLKIPQKANKIFDIYRSKSSLERDLVFDYLTHDDLKDSKQLAVRTKTITRNLNRHLKKVGKKLNLNKKISMHIARHSFGNISGDKIPIQMLQKLYRHSSITTTMQYQANFIHKDADEALDNVVNF